MAILSEYLQIDRCPHCAKANPTLQRQGPSFATNDHAGAKPRRWSVYGCGSCGGVVTAWAEEDRGEVKEYFPTLSLVDLGIPERPREYLKQASDCIHAPAGAVMLAASAVDAMLKEKGYLEGSLHARIGQAAAAHVITQDMAQWAHQVRLEANDQRHADAAASLPTVDDAKRVIEFATTLAQILFVLPARVTRGIQSANATPTASPPSS